MSNRRTVEQGRAERAYDYVVEAKEGLGKNDTEYKSFVKKIPMMIKTNGLAATYAFIFSKGSVNGQVKSEKAYGRIYLQTKDWLQNHRNYLVTLKIKDREYSPANTELVSLFTKMDSSQYRAVTVEVLALFGWLRRFADGLIGVDN